MKAHLDVLNRVRHDEFSTSTWMPSSRWSSKKGNLERYGNPIGLTFLPVLGRLLGIPIGMGDEMKNFGTGYRRYFVKEFKITRKERKILEGVVNALAHLNIPFEPVTKVVVSLLKRVHLNMKGYTIAKFELTKEEWSIVREFELTEEGVFVDSQRIKALLGLYFKDILKKVRNNAEVREGRRRIT
jgi:hypothetical protein